MSELEKAKKKIAMSILGEVKMTDAGKSDGLNCCVGPSSPKERVYYPSIYLDLSQAPGLSGYDVGDKVLMIVEGEVCSHSKNESDGKSNESYAVECKKIGCLSL